MSVAGEKSIALAKALPTFSGGERAILLLAYPKAQALADARKLQLGLAVTTLLGIALDGVRDLAGGRTDHAAFSAARRSRGEACQRRACPGPCSRQRRACAPRDELQ